MELDLLISIFGLILLIFAYAVWLHRKLITLEELLEGQFRAIAAQTMVELGQTIKSDLRADTDQLQAVMDKQTQTVVQVGAFFETNYPLLFRSWQAQETRISGLIAEREQLQRELHKTQNMLRKTKKRLQGESHAN